jgi:hypothetical protein
MATNISKKHSNSNTIIAIYSLFTWLQLKPSRSSESRMVSGFLARLWRNCWGKIRLRLQDRLPG